MAVFRVGTSHLKAGDHLKSVTAPSGTRIRRMLLGLGLCLPVLIWVI